MRKTALLIAIALLAGAAVASAGIVGTKHDLKAALPNTAQVCVFCHTPHNALYSGTSTEQRPLWNHTASSATSYGAYDSVTLDGSPATFGGSTNSSSALCMSCHDGSIGIGSINNKPNQSTGGEETPTNATVTMTGNANLGTDLSNDHPVNFTYDASLSSTDGGLNDPTATPISNWLFGGTVQCASCHDVHDNTNFPFLNASNTNSAICTTCHSK